MLSAGGEGRKTQTSIFTKLDKNILFATKKFHYIKQKKMASPSQSPTYTYIQKPKEKSYRIPPEAPNYKVTHATVIVTHAIVIVTHATADTPSSLHTTTALQHRRLSTLIGLGSLGLGNDPEGDVTVGELAGVELTAESVDGLLGSPTVAGGAE